ncbi:hypothetical protein [Streptomyces sp. NPDC001978]|uniref:hypothetical protein n=1 Tax=Streptomyces sp. NPDC001978 TaxID=3364627 RepID=UPI0036CBBB10
MTKTRFSHATCSHPSTKAGRAGCRKQMRDAALGETAVKAATTAKAGVAQTESAPADTSAPGHACTLETDCPVCGGDQTKWPISESTPASDVTTDDAAEGVASVEPTEITRETWKEHKNTAAQVHVKGVDEPFAAQAVTGWSIKFLQFTDAEGKRQQIPASTVERVTV